MKTKLTRRWFRRQKTKGLWHLEGDKNKACCGAHIFNDNWDWIEVETAPTDFCWNCYRTIAREPSVKYSRLL
jgi:hypothetical protein